MSSGISALHSIHSIQIQASAIFSAIHCQISNYTKVRNIYCIHAECNFLFRLVKAGGYIIMGGLLEEPYYSFGTSKFTAHNLTEQELMENLEEGGFDMERLVYFKHEAGVFMIVAQKKQ